MSTHAKLSPSGAHRWMHCAASVCIPRLAEDTQSIHARKGTAAHGLLEARLNGESEPEEVGGIKIDAEIRNAVESAYLTIQKILKSARNPEMYTEYMLTASQVDRSLWGTADVVIDAENALWVIDYKHGAGVEVEIEDNPQLAIYGLGAVAEFSPYNDLHLLIIQPRARSGQVIKEQVIQSEQLDSWVEKWKRELRKAIARINTFGSIPYGQRFVSGDHCQWCPVLGLCPRMIEQTVMSIALGTGANYDEFEQRALLEVFAHKKQIEEVLERASGYALNHVIQGGTIPGHKLVTKVSRRMWLDEQEVLKQLARLGVDEKEYLETKLQKLSVIEKIAGKEFVDRYTVKSSPGYTVVPETDRRKAVEASMAEDFEEVKK